MAMFYGMSHGTHVKIAHNHPMVLELIKYQTIMVMLFANHTAVHCLEYHSLCLQVLGCHKRGHIHPVHYAVPHHWLARCNLKPVYPLFVTI